MDNLTFTLIALFIFIFGVVAKRLHRSVITPPMLFVGMGFLMSKSIFGLFELHVEHAIIHTIAELTLILILFTDAAKINLKILKKQYHIPLRLLSIGMPLTIIFGGIFALLLFKFLSFWEAIVLASILAPTDAALGEAVVTIKRIPIRIRQALSVESGLNDGIALPVVLISMALAATFQSHNGGQNWTLFISKQIILGPIVGILIGFIGGKVVQFCYKNEWVDGRFEQMAGLGLALLSFCLAELVGGNGFISAFCAGLTIGNTAKSLCKCLYDFSESEGQLLEFFTFLIFGNVLLVQNMHVFNGVVWLYAILSLTVIRIIPVLLSLMGSGLHRSSKFFIGWFGPRGIASILFGLLVLEHNALKHQEEIYAIVIATVLLSILAHGVTALPWSNWYASHLEKLKDKERAEFLAIKEMRPDNNS